MIRKMLPSIEFTIYVLVLNKNAWFEILNLSTSSHLTVCFNLTLLREEQWKKIFHTRSCEASASALDLKENTDIMDVFRILY